MRYYEKVYSIESHNYKAIMESAEVVKSYWALCLSKIVKCKENIVKS